MTTLTNLLISASTFEEIELEFPNLFGGIYFQYYRGFDLFGKIPIYWYGILITIGVILAYTYAHFRIKDFGLSADRFFDVVFASLIGGFLGARIYYCVFVTLDPTNPKTYDFITTFTEIRDGGLAIYGGIIAALAVGAVMCKLRKVKIRPMFDVAALGFLIGQCIGRWGNFVNQEAHGGEAPEDFLFAMTGDYIDGLVHPCFFYESMWCLIGFIGLHFYSKKLRTYDGEIFLMYIAWYGLGRAFIEGMRTDSLMAGEIRISQLVAIICFVGGLAAFITFKIFTEQRKIPLYVNTDECKELLAADKAKVEADKAKRAAKKAAKEGVAESILADDEDYDSTIFDDEASDTDETDENDEINEAYTEDADIGSDDDSITDDSDSDDSTDE